MSKRVKIGLIGCGMISGSHVNGYLAHPQHAEIVAVCDTVDANAQRRAAEVVSGAEARANTATSEIKKANTAEARERLKENAARWAKYKDNGVKIYNDFNVMLKECELDAVSLATPPFAHEEPTVAAANAGKHVFCEKPMARTATEARSMRDAIRQALNLLTRVVAHALTLRVTPYGSTLPLENSAMSTTEDLPVTESGADPM